MVSIEKALYHRSRIDIIANILAITEHGAKKTHIMYQCNLSYRQLNTYMQLLNEMQLITHNKTNPTLYQTTQKGKNFTQAYKNMKTILTSNST